MTTVLGVLPCVSCHQPVLWDRVGTTLRLMERRGHTYRRHRCAARCGAFMPVVKERCARRTGHADSHRSRYALDNQARQRRAGFAA